MLGGLMHRSGIRSVRSRVTAVVGVVGLCAAALVTTAGVTAADVAAQKQPKIDRDAVLRFALNLDAGGGATFDPVKMGSNPVNAEWLDLIYDVMIHDTPDGKGSPGLATKWAATDPSTVELTLRDGVKFSDGSPFNAAAVQEAWTRLIAA